MLVQAIRARLQQASRLQPFLNRVLRLSCQDETAVVPTLNSVASEFGDSVTLGSYPVCPALAACAGRARAGVSTHLVAARLLCCAGVCPMLPGPLLPGPLSLR